MTINTSLHLKFLPNKPFKKVLGVGNLVGWWWSKTEELEKLDETGEKLIQIDIWMKLLLWVKWFQSLGDISENKHCIISLRDLNGINFPLSPNIGFYLSRLLPHWGGSSSPRDKAPQAEKLRELTSFCRWT